MRELSTIQKREKLNRVGACDEAGPGGANHEYKIVTNEYSIDILFQKGPRKDKASESGAVDSDLLEIVRDRLKAFQAGPYNSRENACALTHVEEALMWMNRRIEDRIKRGVLGTYNK